MRQIYLMTLLVFSMLLVACNGEIVKQVSQSEEEEKEIRYAKLLEKDEVKEAGTEKEMELNKAIEIVETSLINIEERIPYYWDTTDDTLQLIEQMHLTSSDKDNSRQKKLLEETKSLLKGEVTSEALEKLSRYFLITGHSSMHKDYIHVGDLHARLSVTNQTENSFDFTFITVDDPDAGFAIPAETRLSYEYDDKKWKLADLQQVFPHEKPLNITFDDLEEFYDNYTDGSISFRPIEEEKINGIRYLTYQLGDRTITRNAETSELEYSN